MVLAGITDTGFKVVLLLHILAVIVAFAPAFVRPLLGRHANVGASALSGADGAPAPEVVPAARASILARVLDPIVHGAALVLAGLFGLALIGMSNKAYEFSDTWVSIALLLWILMLAVFFAALMPFERQLRDEALAADRRALLTQRVSMFYGMLHLLLVLQLIDMIFGP